MLQSSIKKFRKMGTVCKLNVFLREIKFQLQKGSHLQKFCPEACQFLGETTLQLIHGDPVRCCSSG